MATRRCKTCQETFPLDASHFRIGKRYTGGFVPHCRNCYNALARARREKLHPKKPTRVVPEGMKHCCVCATIKPKSSFNRSRCRPDGHQPECRECQKKNSARYHAKMKAINVKRSDLYDGTKECARCEQALRRTEFYACPSNTDGLSSSCRTCYYERAWEAATEHHERLEEAKRGEVCVNCGEDDPVVIDFDHVRWEEKETVIGPGVTRTDEVMFTEMAKTQFLCANCHADKTGREQLRKCPGAPRTPKPAKRRARQLHDDQRATAGRCVDCALAVPDDGYDRALLRKFHWDHRDRSNKSFTISTGAGLGFEENKLLKEIAKCDLRCANCLRRRTAKQFNFRVYDRAPLRTTALPVPWAAISEMPRKSRAWTAFLIADGLLERYGETRTLKFETCQRHVRRLVTTDGETLRRVDLVSRLLQRWENVSTSVIG